MFLKNSYSEKFWKIPSKISVTASRQATNVEYYLYSLYLTRSFPSSSFSAKEYLSLLMRLNCFSDEFLEFTQEKQKPENLLVRNFSTLSLKNTLKLQGNGFFCCNHFK